MYDQASLVSRPTTETLSCNEFDVELGLITGIDILLIERRASGARCFLALLLSATFGKEFSTLALLIDLVVSRSCSLLFGKLLGSEVKRRACGDNQYFELQYSLIQTLKIN